MSEHINNDHVQQIAEALARGSKIEAIKIYRESTGKGLKESKDFIDTLIPKLITEDPEKYSKLSAGSGCASAILLCAGVSGAITWLVKAI